jgi:hypothetical protein
VPLYANALGNLKYVNVAWIDIFIGSLVKQISFDQLKPRLLAMDPVFDDEQLLNTLIRYEASDKEKEDLKKFISNPDSDQNALSEPDKFCLEVSEVEVCTMQYTSMLYVV